MYSALLLQLARVVAVPSAELEAYHMVDLVAAAARLIQNAALQIGDFACLSIAVASAA